MTTAADAVNSVFALAVSIVTAAGHGPVTVTQFTFNNYDPSPPPGLSHSQIAGIAVVHVAPFSIPAASTVATPIPNMLCALLPMDRELAAALFYSQHELISALAPSIIHPLRSLQTQVCTVGVIAASGIVCWYRSRRSRVGYTDMDQDSMFVSQVSESHA